MNICPCLSLLWTHKLVFLVLLWKYKQCFLHICLDNLIETWELFQNIFVLMRYQSLIFFYILLMLDLCICYMDYWSEDFDKNKNCKEEKLIIKLLKEENPSRCASKQAGIWIKFTWCVSTLVLTYRHLLPTSKVYNFLTLGQPLPGKSISGRGERYKK